MINLYLKNFNFNLSNFIGAIFFYENDGKDLIKLLKESNIGCREYAFADFKPYFNIRGGIAAGPLGFPFEGISGFLRCKAFILKDLSINGLEDAVLFNAVCDYVLNNGIIFYLKAANKFAAEDIFSLYGNLRKDFRESQIADIYGLRLNLLAATRLIKDYGDNGYTSSLAYLVKKISSLGFCPKQSASNDRGKSGVYFYDEKNFEICIKINPFQKIIRPESESISKDGLTLNASLSQIYFYPDELIKKIKIFASIGRGMRCRINGKNKRTGKPPHCYDGLSGIQAAALKELDSPHLVIAGAGSGKTKLIVNKFLYLLNFIPFGSILVLTFTNNAVNEIKNRIFAEFKNKGINNGSAEDKILNISTYHGFFFSLIKEFYKELGFESIPSIKENKDISCNSGDKKFISLNDLIPHVLTLFNNNAIVYDIARRYRYILVDEYQDLDFLSDCIIKKLDCGRGNIIYAGDDDQSIYRFNGGDFFNILFFDLFYPSGKIFIFQNNYRSHYKIIDFCNSILNKINFRYPKKLTSEKTGEERTAQTGQSNPLNFLGFKNKNSEENFIAEGFKGFISRGKSAAILVRTKKEANYFKEVIEKFYADSFICNDKAFIGTIHQSKGLEFDAVFIANVTQGNIPHLKSMQSDAAGELKFLRHPFVKLLDKEVKLKTLYDDEVKLFYVAVSRAKEKVFISYSGKKSDFLIR